MLIYLKDVQSVLACQLVTWPASIFAGALNLGNVFVEPINFL